LYWNITATLLYKYRSYLGGPQMEEVIGLNMMTTLPLNFISTCTYSKPDCIIMFTSDCCKIYNHASC